MSNVLEFFSGTFSANCYKNKSIIGSMKVPSFPLLSFYKKHSCPCPIHVPILNILLAISLCQVIDYKLKKNDKPGALDGNNKVNIFLSAFEICAILYNLAIIYTNWGLTCYICGYLAVIGIKSYLDPGRPISLHPSIQFIDFASIKGISMQLLIESLAGVFVNLIYFFIKRTSFCFDLKTSALRVPLLKGMVYEMLGTLSLLLSTKYMKNSNLKNKDFLQPLIELIIISISLGATGGFYYPPSAIARNLTSELKIITLIAVYIVAPILAMLAVAFMSPEQTDDSKKKTKKAKNEENKPPPRVEEKPKPKKQTKKDARSKRNESDKMWESITAPLMN